MPALLDVPMGPQAAVSSYVHGFPSVQSAPSSYSSSPSSLATLSCEHPSFAPSSYRRTLSASISSPSYTPSRSTSFSTMASSSSVLSYFVSSTSWKSIGTNSTSRSSGGTSSPASSPVLAQASFATIPHVRSALGTGTGFTTAASSLQGAVLADATQPQLRPRRSPGVPMFAPMGDALPPLSLFVLLYGLYCTYKKSPKLRRS